MSPPPCLYDTVIQSYVQLKSGSIERTAHSGPSYPLKVNGANFSTPCPPGVQLLTPFWGMVLQSLPASSKCGKFHISVKSTLWATRRQIFFAMLSQWGQIWDAPAPQGCNFYPILRYGLTEPASLLKCGKFHISVKSTFWATRRQSFFSMLSQCVWFCPYFAPGANIVPPIAYKSHSTRFPIRPHVLTPHSWLCDKNCGGVARRNKSGRRRIIITRMYISRRKCEMVLAVAINTTRLLGLLLGGC